MPLEFYPPPGTILLCDYQPGFKVPEMTKRRPVVVISPRFRGRGQLCTVVPLSTTPPRPVRPYHCEIEVELAPPYLAATSWVKADMIATVGFHRLRPLHMGKDQYGKRKHVYPRVEENDLAQIRECVLAALGLR